MSESRKKREMMRAEMRLETQMEKRSLAWKSNIIDSSGELKRIEYLVADGTYFVIHYAYKRRREVDFLTIEEYLNKEK